MSTLAWPLFFWAPGELHCPLIKAVTHDADLEPSHSASKMAFSQSLAAGDRHLGVFAHEEREVRIGDARNPSDLSMMAPREPITPLSAFLGP